MNLTSLLIVGLVALCTSWIRHLSSHLKISYSIIFVLLGVFLFSAVERLPFTLPQYNQSITMHLTKLMVIVALMSAGLRINTPFSMKNWNIPLRLISIGLPLTMLITFIIGNIWLSLSAATSLLLAALLAPTDPVLAADVQVGPPNKKNENSVKFGLTAEAGLSDALIFPVIWFAIFLAQPATLNSSNLLEWFTDELIYRLVIGCITGYLIGKCINYFFFYLPQKYNLSNIQEGLVAFSAAIAVYCLTELLHGYGFIAVFICAVTIRNYEIHHAYHSVLHSFINQIEHILMSVLLLLFGGNLVDGALEKANLNLILTSLAFVLIIRPLCGMVSLIGSSLSLKNRLIASFFGIRGVGSFFYLFFALEHIEFAQQDQVLTVTYLVVLLSILFHGFSSPRLMKALKKE